MGFENQDVRGWVGHFEKISVRQSFETLYISGSVLQKIGVKRANFSKFSPAALKNIVQKWVWPQKLSYMGGLGHKIVPILHYITYN